MRFSSTTNLRIVALAVIAAASIFGYIAQQRSIRFERKASVAEAVNRLLKRQVAVDLLAMDSLEHVSRGRDTVVIRLKALVAHVDSVNPVPDTCLPNIAARDAIIAQQDTLIFVLRQTLVFARVTIGGLTEANRVLEEALASRPHLFSRLNGPGIGLGAGIGVDPIAVLQGKPLALRATIGLTIQLGGIKL